MYYDINIKHNSATVYETHVCNLVLVYLQYATMLTPRVLRGLSIYSDNYFGVENSLKCAGVLQVLHPNAGVLCADASVLLESIFSAQNECTKCLA